MTDWGLDLFRFMTDLVTISLDLGILNFIAPSRRSLPSKI
jgi:hypothetical protein